jgi:hypothetical protein
MRGRLSFWVALACYLALVLFQVGDAIRVLLIRVNPDAIEESAAQIGIDPYFEMVRLSLTVPIDLVLALAAGAVIVFLISHNARVYRWRRTATILFALMGLWLIYRGGASAIEGGAMLLLTIVGMIAVGRATDDWDAEPFILLEPGVEVHVAPSGLRWQDVDGGMGPLASPGRTAVVHYTGWLTDGRKFDSTRDRHKPFEFKVGAGRVIRAWDEGVSTMHQGGRRRLIVPPDLGYGQMGAGKIPPGATLVFDVELVDVR